MDFIQRNICVQTGKTTERTIYYHPTTTPLNQMVQPITISMDTWVKHVTIFQLVFSYHHNATITVY